MLGPPAELPAVHKPKHLSVSQIRTMDLCNAKWWLEKIAGLSTPSTLSQQLGTEVHAAIEAYLKHGARFPDTRAGRLAASGVHLLPAPASGLGVEVRVDVPGTLPLMGYIDLLETPEIGTYWITDHKTTSSPAYADTEDKLAADLQLHVYAHAVRLADPRATRFRLRKNYFLTKGTAAKAWHVTAHVGLDAIAYVPEKIESSAQKALYLAGLREREVPRNLDACGAFGGCPFRDRCLSPSDAINNLFAVAEKRKDRSVSDFDKETFFRTLGAQAPALPPAPVAAAPMPPAVPIPPAPVAVPETDPVVVRIVNSLQENQIRFLYGQIVGAPGGADTRSLTLKLADTLRGNEPALTAWIAFTVQSCPAANPAPINPPEAALAIPAATERANMEAVAPPAAFSENPERKRAPKDEAQTANERELRAILRKVSQRDLNTLYLQDNQPTVNAQYEAVRREIQQGIKYPSNQLINALARELDAKGVKAAEYSPHVAAHLTPQPAAVKPEPLPPGVTVTAFPPAVSLSPPPLPAAPPALPMPPAPVAPAFPLPPGSPDPVTGDKDRGILATEAQRIDAALKAMPERAFQILFWHHAAVTPRFTAFRAGLMQTGITNKDHTIHEMICDYQNQGIKSYDSALALWSAICGKEGYSPAGEGIPTAPTGGAGVAFPLLGTSVFPAPVAVAPEVLTPVLPPVSPPPERVVMPPVPDVHVAVSPEAVEYQLAEAGTVLLEVPRKHAESVRAFCNVILGFRIP